MQSVTLTCPCGKVCLSKGGLALHKRSCKKADAPIVEEIKQQPSVSSHRNAIEEADREEDFETLSIDPDVLDLEEGEAEVSNQEAFVELPMMCYDGDVIESYAMLAARSAFFETVTNTVQEDSEEIVSLERRLDAIQSQGNSSVCPSC